MAAHVFPLNDLKVHCTDDLGEECPCNPRVEWLDPEDGLPYPNGPLVIHNSFDGRELME